MSTRRCARISPPLRARITAVARILAGLPAVKTLAAEAGCTPRAVEYHLSADMQRERARMRKRAADPSHAARLAEVRELLERAIYALDQDWPQAAIDVLNRALRLMSPEVPRDG